LKLYVSAIARLAKHYHASPDRLTYEQLKAYVFHLAHEKKLAAGSLSQAVSGPGGVRTLLRTGMSDRNVRAPGPAAKRQSRWLFSACYY
jgi:hypothetical protein